MEQSWGLGRVWNNMKKDISHKILFIVYRKCLKCQILISILPKSGTWIILNIQKNESYFLKTNRLIK